jgi:hypothetical protein
MNVDQLRSKLLAAARAHPPADRVPYAFAQRVIARLRAGPLPDVWDMWGRALWRAAAPCVAIMLVLSAWSLLAPPPSPAAGDLAQELDSTVLAAAAQDQAPAELPR